MPRPLRDGDVFPLRALLSRRDFCRIGAGGLALLATGCPGPEPTSDGAPRPPANDLAATDLHLIDPGDLAAPSDLAASAHDLATADPGDLAVAPPTCPGWFIRTARPPAAFALGTATFVEPAESFVCRDAAGWFAVSAVCTHQGATVEPAHDGRGAFRCPLHFSRFALDGAVVAGPAVHPLPHHPLCLDDAGHVGIDIARNAPGDRRTRF